MSEPSQLILKSSLAFIMHNSLNNIILYNGQILPESLIGQNYPLAKAVRVYKEDASYRIIEL